jgi:hypothetical protein
MLSNLPRQIGQRTPRTESLIEAAIGRFGPYVKHGKVYANLREVDEVFDHRDEPRRGGARAESLPQGGPRRSTGSSSTA